MNTTRERRWRAMGTDCHVVVVLDEDDADPAASRAATRAAVVLVEHLEARWSRFRPTSDIARVNEAAGEPVVVAPETLDAMELALEARDRTAGRFDPTVLPALVAAGYDRCFDRLPHRPSASAPPRHAAGADVRVDRGSGSVAVSAGAGIDLGGIGKGLAADRVASALLRLPGVLGACVNLGGDLRVDGVAPDPEPRAWGVALDGGELLAVAAGGVATSTTTRRRWTTAAGEQHHHVIDPRSGRPSQGPVHTATLVAATAADAEVLATAALLDPATVDDATPALLVGADGTVTTTPAMEAYLR